MTRVYVVKSDHSLAQLVFPPRQGRNNTLRKRVSGIVKTAEFRGIFSGGEYGVFRQNDGQYIGRAQHDYVKLIEFCTKHNGGKAPKSIYVV